MEPTLKVAKKYPNVHFEHATGYKRDKNMSTYSGRFYEGRYIQGIIAARCRNPACSATSVRSRSRKSSRASMPRCSRADRQSEHQGQDHLGQLLVRSGKEADAAKALLDQGADVIMQHTDSPAPMQVASERGKLAFGQDSEMIKFGPKAQLTSIMDNWGPYYIERVKAELAGTWKSEDFLGWPQDQDRRHGALHQHA